MEIKHVSKILLNTLISIFSFVIYAQESYLSDKIIYIEVDLTDIINLNENYLVKTENENQITFSIGIETLGEINDFIFSKENNLQKKISFKEFENLNFSIIKKLNKTLIKKGMFKKPNEIFKEIYIVERSSTKCLVTLYEVLWKKRLFLE